MKILPPAYKDRRIVLEYRNGPYAGLKQIVGVVTDQPGSLIAPTIGDRQVPFSLVRATGRLVYYREVVAPAGSGAGVDIMDPGQQ